MFSHLESTQLVHITSTTSIPSLALPVPTRRFLPCFSPAPPFREEPDREGGGRSPGPSVWGLFWSLPRHSLRPQALEGRRYAHQRVSAVMAGGECITIVNISV